LETQVGVQGCDFNVGGLCADIFWGYMNEGFNEWVDEISVAIGSGASLPIGSGHMNKGLRD